MNNKINRIPQRALRSVNSDYDSNFDGLLLGQVMNFIVEIQRE